MVLVPGPKPLGQRKTDVSSIDRKFDPNYPALPYINYFQIISIYKLYKK